MDILKKIKTGFKTGFSENILHNTYTLYLIAFISFGNFFMEMMSGNMYFISVYIIIGFLTSFFNKNMIIILFMSLIFANILTYGRSSTVEGFDGEDEEKSDLDKALGTEDTKDDGVIDKIVGDEKKEKKDKKEKKEKKDKKDKKDEDSDEDEESDDEEDKKEKKKKKTKEKFTEQELKHMEYKESEKLLENQNLLLKNMKEYKPFLETIQGIAKNVSGFVKKDSE